MIFLEYLKHFIKPLLFFVTILTVGTIGYMHLEGWTLLESIYMTAITISTVGFGEIRPLSEAGRIFTMFVLLSGVGFFGISINSLIQKMMDLRYKDVLIKFRMDKKIKELKNHYIICGGGRMAYTIGLELERSNKEFVFIEKNPKAPINEKREDWPIIMKDALLEETLIEAGINHALGLAAVLPTDSDNLFVVLSARSLNNNIYIITRIAFESTRKKMEQAGANKIISPYSMGGMQMARHFINPEIHEYLEIFMDKASFDFEFKLHKISKNDLNNRKALKNSNFRKTGFIIISIKTVNKEMIFAPDANYILNEGDEIMLLGTKEHKKN